MTWGVSQDASHHHQLPCAGANVINSELVNNLAGRPCVSVKKGLHEWETLIDIYLWES